LTHRRVRAFCLAAVLISFGSARSIAQGQAEKTRAPGLVTQQNQQVVRLPDDTLVSYYLQTTAASQSVASKSSNDNGHSWSAAQDVCALPSAPEPFSGIWSLVANDGKVHLFFFNNSGIWYSKPEGDGWQAPKSIFAGRPGVLRSALQLASGRLVLPFYYAVKRNWWNGSEKGLDRFAYMGNYITSTLYSDDGGDIWKQSPEIIKIPTPSLSQNGAVDPVLLLKKDGTIWMVIANQRGHLYEAFSTDGVSWSENHPTRFISSGAPASVTRLKDGRIVLLWNGSLRFPYLHGGTYVLHGAISEDDGKSWRGFREIYRDPHRAEPDARGAGYGTGYPTAVATGDGKLLIHAGQGNSVTTILLDPQSLYETRQRDDFSHGVDAWSVFGTKGVDLVAAPEGSNRRVLSVRKVEEEWPAAAVWNFPAGQKGQVLVRLRLNRGFRGAHLSLTDHFSVPFDSEAELNAVYDLAIGPDGQIASGTKLAPNRWYELAFAWDPVQRKCSVTVDGRQVAVLPQLKVTNSGPNYLRVHATAERPGDAGFLVESVAANVSSMTRSR
jgi:hypothetical protein